MHLKLIKAQNNSPPQILQAQHFYLLAVNVCSVFSLWFSWHQWMDRKQSKYFEIDTPVYLNVAANLRFRRSFFVQLFNTGMLSRQIAFKSTAKRLLSLQQSCQKCGQQWQFYSSHGGLEVEHLLRIQLKASHYCLGGSNPAWGDYTCYEHVICLYGPYSHRRVLTKAPQPIRTHNTDQNLP